MEGKKCVIYRQLFDTFYPKIHWFSIKHHLLSVNKPLNKFIYIIHSFWGNKMIFKRGVKKNWESIHPCNMAWNWQILQFFQLCENSYMLSKLSFCSRFSCIFVTVCFVNICHYSLLKRYDLIWFFISRHFPQNNQPEWKNT